MKFSSLKGLPDGWWEKAGELHSFFVQSLAPLLILAVTINAFYTYQNATMLGKPPLEPLKALFVRAICAVFLMIFGVQMLQIFDKFFINSICEALYRGKLMQEYVDRDVEGVFLLGLDCPRASL